MLSSKVKLQLTGLMVVTVIKPNKLKICGDPKDLNKPVKHKLLHRTR